MRAQRLGKSLLDKSPVGPSKRKHDFYNVPYSVQKDFKISHKPGDTQKCQVI